MKPREIKRTTNYVVLLRYDSATRMRIVDDLDEWKSEWGFHIPEKTSKN